MELVYLWVEDYKNIHQQGFNFSGRYRCDYDHDKKELTIDKNDDHVHIFPENINVTAIVGENGAGKSSICEEILNIISSKILVFNINTIWYIRKPDEVNVIFKDHTENYQALDLKSFHAIYLHTDIIKPNEIVNWLTFSNAGTNFANPYHLLLKPATNDSVLDLAKFQKEFYLLIFKYFSEHKTNVFDFTPSNSVLSITPLPKLSKKISFNLENKDNEEDFIFRTNRVEGIINAVIKHANASSNIQEIFLAFLLKKYVQNISDIEKFNWLGLYEAADYVAASDMIETEDGDYIFKDESTYTAYDFEDKILGYSYTEDKELYTSKTVNENSKKFRQYVELLQSIEEYIGQSIEIEEAFDLISYDKDLFFTLVRIGFIEIDFSDDFGRSFFKLSHGERKFFTDSLLLYDEIFKNEKNNALILLDEPDLALHPRWQKQYISQLISTFNKVTEKYIHFVISSHSPFMLSDIPKENVIFLKDGTQDKTVNIDTFGANIHTLLSHGFFMEDGLMGEFAKEKISQILFLLSGEIGPINIPNEQIKPIIKIIGEDFLREKLLKMYDKKFLTKEEQISRLQKQIDELKNAKN